jgi:hypothetical protein
MTDNIFAPESMSDLSFTQTTMHMKRYNAAQDPSYPMKTPGNLAACHNRKMKRVIIRENGVIVSDKFGYAKSSTKRYKYGS